MGNSEDRHLINLSLFIGFERKRELMIRNLAKLVKGSYHNQHARCSVLNFLEAALQAVDPRLLVQKALTCNDNLLSFARKHLKLDAIDGIYVIGAGKASGRMAEATETLLEDHINGGLVIVPKTNITDYRLEYIELLGGGHPTPNHSNTQATQQLLTFLKEIPNDALILSLFSGGGSALLTLPTPPITLQDLQHVTRLLLQSGLPIIQINTIRKHLSQVKGGQLASHIYPRHHWGLLISDVPGDQLDMVASGPTFPDSTTFADVNNILKTNHLWEHLPIPIREHFTKGLNGEISDTPKPGDPIFESSTHKLIGSNLDACNAALASAKANQYPARILTTDCQGEAREVGEKLGKIAQNLAKQAKPQVYIIGSETTVTVRHEGKGGRNTELITAALSYLQGTEGLAIASLATDGIDGPTDAAGAIGDGDSFHRAASLNLSPLQLLTTNNTYSLFHALDDLLITGPTHTNVRDITIIYWGGSTR